MKKFVSKIRTSIKVPEIKPLYLIIAVVVIVLLIIIGVVLIGGGDDDDGAGGGGGDDGSDAARGFAEGDRSRLPGADTKPVKEAPRVRSGLVDEARREGRLAVAQARGTIIEPSRVRIRVSSAPKQVVWVTWQLGCYKDGKATLGRGRYEAQTPNTRPIELPVRGAESCIVTASAQLTRLNTEGRIKVGVLAGG